MTGRLLTGLALARGDSRAPLELKNNPNWWDAALAAGTLGVAVAGERIDADEDARLNWLPVTEGDRGRAVLLSASAEGIRVALLTEEAGPWPSLRVVGADLADSDAAAATAAVALASWHARHPRCPRCGAVTEMHEAGWARICPQDASVHFPRTDPAVIVLVRDEDDRALLGRRADWPVNWFSTLAGFVEAGESAEQAVAREIAEEAGVSILPESLDYRGSQPWPFPSSLMFGYHARVAGSAPATTPDLDEIAEARWLTRAELAAGAADGSVRVPPPVSIARHLIEDWFGDRLPSDWSRP
jgi:NAD+ diphosphatase